MRMLFFIYTISVLSFSSFASTDCVKKVHVKETIRSFKANVLFPKITTTESNKDIYISCKMYESVKIGDTLYLPEDIKKINEEKIFNFIPQGSMDRVEYKLLRK